jgi:hypothetical protein
MYSHAEDNLHTVGYLSFGMISNLKMTQVNI